MFSNNDIEKEAKKLGIVLQDETYLEFEQRVQRAKEDKRKDKLFVIAIVSAIFSAISAVAAWVAILK